MSLSPPVGAPLLLDNALAQSDLDMNHFRLLNLDTSNLPPVGIPPSFTAPPHEWINSWNSTTRAWGATQPQFADIGGGTLTETQQRAINFLGTILLGHWQASIIQPPYLPTLDLIRTPQGNVALSGYRLTGLGNPVDPQDAVTLSFMDSLLEGLNPKQAVRLASTGSYIPPVGLRAIDGVTPIAGDRILLKDQAAAPGRGFENGIWIASATPWTRATDCDHGSGDSGENKANDINGAYCVVLQGTVNAGDSFVNTAAVINIGTQAPNFVLFSTSGAIVAGNGLQFAGNILNVLGHVGRISVGTTVDIDAGYVGQNSITTLGTITTGVWNASILRSVYGGTGVDNNDHVINLGGADLGIVIMGTAIGTDNLTFQIGPGVNIVSVPGSGRLATTDQSETFTNKWIVPRSLRIASNPQPTINTDTLDTFYITALAADITSMSANLSGTPVDSQELILWIKDNGTSRNINWGAGLIWHASTDLPLPTATSAGFWLFMRFVFNGVLGAWVLTNKLDHI